MFREGRETQLSQESHNFRFSLFVILTGIHNQSRRTDLIPPVASKLITDLKSSEIKSNQSLERLWELEGASNLAFDEKTVAIVRNLINSSVALYAAAQSPDEADQIKATNEFGERRGEASLAFLEHLKQE